MKLVFTKEECAAALGKSSRRFDELRPNLEKLGFPKPVPGLGACWSVMQVMNWVNSANGMDPAAFSPAGLQGGGADEAPAPPPMADVVSIQQRLERKYGARG